MLFWFNKFKKVLIHQNKNNFEMRHKNSTLPIKYRFFSFFLVIAYCYGQSLLPSWQRDRITCSVTLLYFLHNLSIIESKKIDFSSLIITMANHSWHLDCESKFHVVWRCYKFCGTRIFLFPPDGRFSWLFSTQSYAFGYAF